MSRMSIESAAEHVTRQYSKDAKISERDLHDRLLKQARMEESQLYEEASRDAPVMHRRPALTEAPGGFTQMPAALKQATRQLEYYHTFSGVFPQIHRAWTTIDHVLFLWDYTDPRGSFYQYDGLDQTIIHAALVRPRHGVFEEGATPQWLLLLSTPVEVVVLGLYTMDGPAISEIDIFETGFSVATEGANLLQIVGTPNGRVFMAGADGFLYELTYGTTRGWLDTYRTCTKRNRSRKYDVALNFVTSAMYDTSDPILDLAYDAERHILYSLSRASTLQMHDLGAEGESFKYVAAIDVKSIASKLRTDGSVRDTEALRKFESDIQEAEKARASSADAELHCALVSISPIPAALSHVVQLVLITASGARIYVQTVAAAGSNPLARPVHIRPYYALPPPHASDGRKLRCLRGSVLCIGELAMLASGVEDVQQGGVELLCLTDLPLPPIDRPGVQAIADSERCLLSRLRLQGSVLAIAAEVTASSAVAPPAYEMLEQHGWPPRSYVVLTSDGAQRLRKSRPVDELLQASASALSTLYAGLASPVEAFFARYGPDEGCSMCLLAALASEPNLGAQVAGWAAALGGSALQDTSAAVHQQQGKAATAQGQAIRLPTPRFSGRHGGIVRLLARLLAPHWSQSIAIKVSAAANGLGGSPGAAELRMRAPCETWRAIQQSLCALVAHLDTYAVHWGRAATLDGGEDASAATAATTAGGGQALRNVLYSDSVATRERWRGVEAAHAAAREAEAIDALVCFARRAAEATAFLATIAPASSSGAVAGSGEPPRLRLLQRLASRLEPKLHTALTKLTLGELIVPLLKDANGRSIAGKWDDNLEVKLPKALFMELGGADGGGALTAELQRHCPAFFSSADQTALRGWSLLSQASQPSASHEQRTELMAQAVHTFGVVVGHIDLPKLLGALLAQRAALASSPAAAAAIATIDAGLAELPLAAARAADPAFAATPLLVGDKGGAIGEWPSNLRGMLATRLRCYRLLLAQIDLLATPAPPIAPLHPNDHGHVAGEPKMPAVATRGGSDCAWLRVLGAALRVQPSDELFHYAAFLHLLHTKRDAVLLRLPSPHLLRFVTSPPLSDAARQLWSRFLHVAVPEEIGSLEALLAAPVSPGWPPLEALLAGGALLPRFHFENQRFVEAAVAFAELADRSDTSAPPPPAATDPLLPAPAIPVVRMALHARQRLLEERISHISMALAAAAGAGGAAASGLGADFVRSLEENAQRGQLQLRLASELATLLTSEAALRALLPHTAHANGASLATALDTFHAQICGALLELNELFKGAWAARLWWPLLSILDFAQPYREYPQCVSVALQHILSQPPEVWVVSGGGGRAPLTPWATLSSEVVRLRRAFTSEYIFQPDVIVASLEAHQLAVPRPESERLEGGAVVRMLCSRTSATARPPVPWTVLYECYGSAERCGPLMKLLWNGERAALGSVGRQRLHLTGGLATLITEWLEEARGTSGDRAGLAGFAAAQRRLGVSADLERTIAELDGVRALLGDNQLLAENAELLRRQLRRLLHDLNSIGHL